MGKTYQALKRAEAQPGTGRRSRLDDLRVDGRPHGSGLPDVDERASIQYQRIRVRLTSGAPSQTVMVVSCRSGAGATTTAALLAGTLAEGKRFRVCVVDVNFRTSAIGNVFNLRENGGLADVLDQHVTFEARLQATERPNLSVLTCGVKNGESPVELLEGESLGGLIVEMRKTFDFVIFDAAPVLQFPDAYALAPKVDGIIVVIDAERTSIEDGQRARKSLEDAGGRILGVVLNRERAYVPRLLGRWLGQAD
jgi:capsular exopolysaccharide synthesis family protein